jgi:hypothetical protein
MDPNPEKRDGQRARRSQTHAGKWPPSQCHGAEQHDSRPRDGDQLEPIKEDLSFQHFCQQTILYHLDNNAKHHQRNN